MADVLVLCYHALSPTWTAELSVTPTEFERQISRLHRRGWRAVTFTDAVFAPPAPRTLAITFDDAFASIKQYAVPILAAYKMPATVFAPTAFTSSGATLRWPGIDHWQTARDQHELISMSWDDLGDLIAGGWEVGSHARTHPHLTRLDDESLAIELGESRAECTRALGRPCQTIAYPYGDVDARVADAARRAGYRAGAALSSRLSRLGPYRHPRVGVYHRDVARRFDLKAARLTRELRSSRVWKAMI